MIPKVIHYCWFGGNPLPNLAKKCINSWKKYCRDYQIIEWNESNYDISSAPLYVRQAYEAKKWAFVSDYVRLQIVFEHGGIYFDTDVEVVRNFDDLLDCGAFFGFENEHFLNTGIGFGADKGAEILKNIIDDYREIAFIKNDGTYDMTPCVVRNMRIFENFGVKPENEFQKIEDVLIYPKEYFCPKNYLTGELNVADSTYSIHHFDGSWYNKEQREKKMRRDRLNRKIRRKDKIHNFFAKIYHKIKK